MTPEDIAKVRARLDLVNDPRMPILKRDWHMAHLGLNARRDLTVMIEHIEAQDALIQELRDRAARTESPTAYAQIRPVNHTIDLPKVADTGDLGRPAGLRASPPPIPRLDTSVKPSPEDALRQISQLLEHFK
jgi:hypothetical protein